jgi:hypothetical protein
LVHCCYKSLLTKPGLLRRVHTKSICIEGKENKDICSNGNFSSRFQGMCCTRLPFKDKREEGNVSSLHITFSKWWEELLQLSSNTTTSLDCIYQMSSGGLTIMSAWNEGEYDVYIICIGKDICVHCEDIAWSWASMYIGSVLMITERYTYILRVVNDSFI